MPAPAPLPPVQVPPRVLPPKDVLNAVAMGMVHDLDEAIQGIKPYVEGRDLPEKVTQEQMIVGFAMTVHGCLTHIAAQQKDGSNPFPAKFGDLLLSVRERAVPKRWRDARKRIKDLLLSPDWPLLDERKNFRSLSVARFMKEVLDLMYEVRKVYIVEGAEQTTKLTNAHREEIAKIPQQADDMQYVAALPLAKRNAIIAAVAGGKTIRQAIDDMQEVN